MRKETNKAQQYCEKLGRISKQSARVLKNRLGASSGKRKFDPTEECIVASQQKKKKAANTRAKPREFNLVFLPKTTVFVPKRYLRSKLAKKGRVVKASFRRNMSPVEVYDTITSAFAVSSCAVLPIWNVGKIIVWEHWKRVRCLVMESLKWLDKAVST